MVIFSFSCHFFVSSFLFFLTAKVGDRDPPTVVGTNLRTSKRKNILYIQRKTHVHSLKLKFEQMNKIKISKLLRYTYILSGHYINITNSIMDNIDGNNSGIISSFWVNFKRLYLYREQVSNTLKMYWILASLSIERDQLGSIYFSYIHHLHSPSTPINYFFSKRKSKYFPP